MPDVAASLVLALPEVGRSDVALAGGKGANLGELVRAGFPVPPGFVVTTAAYDLFLTENGLESTISQALTAEPVDAAAIRGAFERGSVSRQLEEAILLAYDRLGKGPVAVRSSATAEDLPGAAFAGQQDTFLNVVRGADLIDAVRRCWASLWTDRAVAYRERRGIEQRGARLAVVVQRMVPADAAGVLFTANPVSGARDEVVVDASPGLGEAIVSGLVTPDHFVLRRRLGWKVLQRQPGLREAVVRLRSGGGTERIASEAAVGQPPVLTDAELRELASLGTRIERHFGAPQDVEWALASDRLFVVQARPITALPEPRRRRGQAGQTTARMVAEMVPVRPYPLDLTTWLPALHGLVGSMFRHLGIAMPDLEEIFVVRDGVVERFGGRLGVRPTARILLAPAALLRSIRRHPLTGWTADPLVAEIEARTRQLEARDLRGLSCGELLATVHDAMAIPSLAGELRLRYLPQAALAAGRLRLVLALAGHGDHFGALLSGTENKTTETNRVLEDLAAKVRADTTLAEAFAGDDAGDVWQALEASPPGRSFLDQVRGFLDRYGHRGAETLVSQPTWREAPEVVIGMLRGLALAAPAPPAAQADWEVARDEVLRHPLLRRRPLRSAFLNVLDRARRLVQLREDTRFYATRPLPVLRQALLEFGRRLAGAGILDAAEDVFHLELAELEQVSGRWPPPGPLAEKLRAAMERRRKRRAELEGTPLVEPGLLGGGRPAGPALLSGTPGSPGVAQGPARIIRDGAEFGRLRPGDVLVAPYTNPAWTPLFQRAAAVVVDSGSVMSHAAIVAREYRIPAVMGTVEGTRTLADGQPVRVDGTRGLVTAAAPPAALRASPREGAPAGQGSQD